MQLTVETDSGHDIIRITPDRRGGTTVLARDCDGCLRVGDVYLTKDDVGTYIEHLQSWLHSGSLRRMGPESMRPQST